MKAIFTVLILTMVFIGCGKENATQETILKGSASILVDESLMPIIQEQIAVFESDYDATITPIARSEKEMIQAFVADTAKIVILARDLTEAELKVFEQKAIKPKRTKFATDGVVLISNQRSADSVVSLSDVIAFIKGGYTGPIRGLVFDNPNSSSVRLLADLAQVSTVPEENVFSFSTNKEAIEFISENEGMIGVVGLNWILETDHVATNVKVLAVKGLTDDNSYLPTQSNIAEGKYPLARDLYIINAQGFAGLGMGFGSFITGDRGQRIILKAGLLPVRLPGRNILVRKQIEKK